MRWFRSNIKHGSRLALFALAVQFVLLFGHFHAVAAAPAIAASLAQADLDYAQILGSPDVAGQVAQQPQPSNHDTDRRTEACAICAVMALANSVVFATPPLLLLPGAIGFLYLTTDAEFVHLNSARVAFQPRAPPAS